MFHLPEFNGSIAHWLCLIFAVTAPALFVIEAKGWGSFGYSKFANRERKFTLPSRLGMFIIYFPAVLLVWLPLLSHGVTLSAWHLLVAGMVSAHFGKRCLETLFVHKYSGVMHTDSVVMICAMYSTQSWVLGELAATDVGPGLMPIPGLDVWTSLGFALWLIGVGINFQHHLLLAKLRVPGELEYKLPRGGLFGYVACPHYLGELIGWIGFSLVFRHIGALMLTFVMVMYLGGRSHNTVKWYRERLGDQVPANWKRLVPFLY
jgi:very-long-chain enoyl-CoA reductase